MTDGRRRSLASRLQQLSRILAALIVVFCLGTAVSAAASDSASATSSASESPSDDGSSGATDEATGEPSDEASDEPSAEPTIEKVGRSGSVTLGKGERRTTVRLEADLVDSSTVTATATLPESGRGATVKRVLRKTDEDAFTIVLDQPAPARTAVTWTAVDLEIEATTDETEDPDDTDFWSVQWLVILLLTTAFLGVISWSLRRTLDSRAGTTPADADRGLLFASFLKVIALLVIASLAVVSVAMIDVEDSANLTALFGLFGAIAGYLAGKTPSVETDVPQDDRVLDQGQQGQQDQQDEQDQQGQPANPAGAVSAPMARRVTRQTLL